MLPGQQVYTDDTFPPDRSEFKGGFNDKISRMDVGTKTKIWSSELILVRLGYNLKKVVKDF